MKSIPKFFLLTIVVFGSFTTQGQGRYPQLTFIQDNDTLDMKKSKRGFKSYNPVNISWKNNSKYTVEKLKIILANGVHPLQSVDMQAKEKMTYLDLSALKKIYDDSEKEYPGGEHKLIIEYFVTDPASNSISAGVYIFSFKLYQEEKWEKSLSFYLDVEPTKKTPGLNILSHEGKEAPKDFLDLLDTVRIIVTSKPNYAWEAENVTMALYKNGQPIKREILKVSKNDRTIILTNIIKHLPRSINPNDKITLSLSFLFIDTITRKILPEKPEIRLNVTY
jgi:hypothetical protein